MNLPRAARGGGGGPCVLSAMDTCDVTRCYPICVLMAIFIHGDLNNSFVCQLPQPTA